jgi:choloylglycine hydrolase
METDNLKGGYTSEERFIRASYLKEKLESASQDDFNLIAQSLHLLSSVEQIYGATPVDDKFEYTIYSVVYDMNELTAAIKTYNDYEVSTYALHQNSKQNELTRFLL